MVSKKVFSAVLVTVMILSVIGGSTAALAQQTVVSTSTTLPLKNTIFEVAQSNKTLNLSTFVKLLVLANLSDPLNGTGTYTVLAPSNDAFAKLNNTTLTDLQNNKTELQNTLAYHVIPQEELLAHNFSGNGTVKTLFGAILPYSVNGTKITFGSGNNTATVTKADINATNGVVHIINGVLQPPTAGAVTASASPAAGAFGLPGFEAVYAVAGLLAVAYLVLRRRK